MKFYIVQVGKNPAVLATFLFKADAEFFCACYNNRWPSINLCILDTQAAAYPSEGSRVPVPSALIDDPFADDEEGGR